MPRIIAGWAGSLALRAPAAGTRPTSDRVREALFSALEARDAIDGARVADLYAGSGALGLEALSRGAASVVLVDRAPAAMRVLRENLAAVRRAAPHPVEATVIQQAVATFLGVHHAPFDLVFLDPPYDLDGSAVTADLTLLLPALASEATVVLERSTRNGDPVLPEGLALDRTRTYGDTAVHLLAPA